MSVATPHATAAYAGSVLAALTAEERQALDAYAARALDDPSASPADDAEVGALRAVNRAADRLARRLVRGARLCPLEGI